MAELRVRHDVQWRGVQDAFEQWDHKQEGLTQAAAVVIALAVTIATQGAASGFASAVTSATGSVAMGKSMAAGFQAVISRAAVSLANNKGDVGKVLRELGSSSSIKSIAASMVTAGLIASMPASVIPAGAANALGHTHLTFAEQLQANIVRGAIEASVSTVIQGRDFGDALRDSMINAAVKTVGAVAATEIGAAAKQGRINYAVQLAAHAALGCGMGAATGGGEGCAGGAAGGVAGEVVAEIYVASQRGRHPTITVAQLEALRAQGIDYARLVGAVSALLVGANVDAAVDTADNAARHNALDTVWDVLNVLYDVGKIGYGYYKDDKG